MLSPTQLPTSYLPSSPPLGTPRLPSMPPSIPSGYTPLPSTPPTVPSFPPQLPTLGTHPPHGGYRHCQCDEKKSKNLENLLPMLLMSVLPMLIGGNEGDDKGMNSMMMMLPMLMGGLGGNSQGGGMEQMLPMMLPMLMGGLGGNSQGGGMEQMLPMMLPMLMGGLGGNPTSSANALASAFAGNGSNPLASLLTA